MIKTRIIALALSAAIAGCGDATDTDQATAGGNGVKPAPSNPADMVFTGSHILTMDSAQPRAEAVAIDDGKIVFVGDKAGVNDLVGEQTRVVELGDRALIPGLIDAHGHFMMMARLADVVQLYPPPVGKVDSIDALVTTLKNKLESDPPKEGQWFAGFGYDDSLLAEERHPTRQELDLVSTDIPIAIMHVSGHLCTVNTKALELLGMGPDTKEPAGGVIRREAGSNMPNGVLEETASHPVMYKLFAGDANDGFRAKVEKAVELYASMGITTMQDGASNFQDIERMRSVTADNPLSLDLAFYPQIMNFDDAKLDAFRHEPTYNNGLRVAGIKFLLDGSPQGRTAWMTHAYDELPDGAEEGYVAYPAYDPELYKSQLATVMHNGVPILAHANGDAAIDAMLDGVEAAFPEGDIPDHRAVIIHAQLMRRDQLDRSLALGAIPSFFSAHTFFWGDWHRRSFGEERASGISPTGSAIEKGLRFTTHNDAPVVLPDMMRLLWATVNRTTRSGHVLGRGERITPEQALKSMTIDAAYQYFEEDVKGSLTVGKQADLVILGADPTEADPDTLADIAIVETIAHGKTVFSAN